MGAAACFLRFLLQPARAAQARLKVLPGAQLLSAESDGQQRVEYEVARMTAHGHDGPRAQEARKDEKKINGAPVSRQIPTPSNTQQSSASLSTKKHTARLWADAWKKAATTRLSILPPTLGARECCREPAACSVAGGPGLPLPSPFAAESHVASPL